MQIELQVEGTSEQLRAFVDKLQAALAEDATVAGWLRTADPDDEPKMATIYVDVFEAPDESSALKRVQPAIRSADPDLTVVKGGTTVWQIFLPAPPPPKEPRRS